MNKIYKSLSKQFLQEYKNNDKYKILIYIKKILYFNESSR